MKGAAPESMNTEHLRLLGFTPQDLLALIEGVAQFEARSGLTVADGLRDFFVSGEVSPLWLERLRTEQSAEPWRHGFAVIIREGSLIIGSAGFKGPPDEEGAVEIAYGIVPAHQGRGYATEAAAALVAFAFGDPRVRLVRAHTLPAPSASTRVLTKCGFARVGELVDPEDGLVWRWQRNREAI
jgi:ribosomal-protein-alanine N-acetyltransferase